MMATLSDASGTVPCTCFEEFTAKEMEDAARVGGCGILTIELDRRPGEDTPRVTVRKVQPFEGMAKDVRLTLRLTVGEPGALAQIAGLLADARGGRCEVIVDAPLPNGGEAELVLGRNFRLDGELATRIEGLPGITRADLKPTEQPKLALAS
jgi:DNA polymerase-3 subunit alpha